MVNVKLAGCVLVLLFSSLFCPESAAQTPVRPPTLPLNLSNLRVDFSNVSARQAALGGAFIGAAQDETAAPTNPAGLTALRRLAVSLHQRQSRARFKEPEGSHRNPDAKRNFHTSNFDQSMVGIGIPFKKIFLGIFRRVAFDSRFNFETEQFLTIEDRPLTVSETLGGLGNFPGRKVNLDIEMVTDAISIAMQLHKRISIGITGKLSILNYKLNEWTFLAPEAISGTLPGNLNQPEHIYSITTVDARQTERHVSIGLMTNLILDKLFLGAVYNFNPSFELRSETFLTEYEIPQEGVNFPATAISKAPFTLNVPDTYGIGLYYRPGNKFNLMLDLVRIEYSDLLSRNDLNVAADDIFITQQGSYQDIDHQPDLTIDDAVELHFGLEYIYKSPKFGLIPLRFGVHTDPQHRIHASGSDPDMRRLFPKAENRTHYSFGFGVVLSNNLKLDSSIDFSKAGYELLGSILVSFEL